MLYFSGIPCCFEGEWPDASSHNPIFPEENGLMERANRTLQESLECEAFDNLVEARKVMNRLVTR